MTTPALSCEIPNKTGKLAGMNVRGTYSGAKRHERLGEKKCEECRLAFNAKKREDRLKDLERQRARVREYWRKNPEKRRENVARFRNNNPEAWKRITDRTYARNRETHILRAKARKARVRAATPFAVSPSSIAARLDYWGRKCWMCGGPYEHIDHVKPIAKGGMNIPANLRPSCAPCNLAKRDKWPLKEMTA